MGMVVLLWLLVIALQIHDAFYQNHAVKSRKNRAGKLAKRSPEFQNGLLAHVSNAQHLKPLIEKWIRVPHLPGIRTRSAAWLWIATRHKRCYMTPMATRLDVHKTYKLFIGGNFVRSESGRYLPAQAPDGSRLDNVCHASRKDFREAVTAARSAVDGWAKKSAYLRGQILYRAAEMLEKRSGELVSELVRSTSTSPSKAQKEVALAIDRLVYFAGWTDKYSQVFGSVNPVATSHFNFTTPEPTGVVVVLAPDEPPLLPLVSLLAPVILSGNSAVAVASEKYPLPSVTFTEILATSDLPGGVINLLTGTRKDLLPHIAGHMDVNAIVDATAVSDIGAKLQAGTALNLKRYANQSLAPEEWFTPKAEDPFRILDTIEFKTAWHPIGL
jgi:hypothetical protein